MRALCIPALATLATFIACAPIACINTPPVVAEGGDARIIIDEDGSFPLGDSGQKDGTTSSDGSTPPADAQNGPDGSAPDVESGGDSAVVDAATADGATPGPVTVIVVTANGPEPGASVVFQSAGGTVVATGTTNASGSVTETVAAGSQVTAVLGTPLSPNLVTIVAVEPGDVLTIVDTSVPPAGSGVNVTAASFPAAAPEAAAFYNAFAGTACFGTGKGAPLTLTPALTTGCVADGEFPLLVLAEGAGTTELAFAYQKGNSAVDAGVSEGGSAVDVAIGGAWTAPIPATLTAANVPTIEDGAFAFGEIAGGVAYEQIAALPTAVNESDGGTPSASFHAHAGYPDFVQTEANALLSNQDIVGGGYDSQSVVAIATRSAATAPATAFDFSQALPAILTGTVSYENAAQPTVSWTTAAPTPTSDGSISIVSWNSGEIDGGEQVGTWTVVAPPTMTVIQLPALPLSLAAWSPNTTGEYVYWNPTLIAIVSGTVLVSGYATLRATSADVWAPWAAPVGSGYSERALIPPLPANGTLLVSAIFPNEGG